MIPDENVFQSALLNNGLKATLTNSNRRFVQFDCGSRHPRTLTCAEIVRKTATAAHGAFVFERAPLIDESANGFVRHAQRFGHLWEK